MLKTLIVPNTRICYRDIEATRHHIIRTAANSFTKSQEVAQEEEKEEFQRSNESVQSMYLRF